MENLDLSVKQGFNPFGLYREGRVARAIQTTQEVLQDDLVQLKVSPLRNNTLPTVVDKLKTLDAAYRDIDPLLGLRIEKNLSSTINTGQKHNTIEPATRQISGVDACFCVGYALSSEEGQKQFQRLLEIDSKLMPFFEKVKAHTERHETSQEIALNALLGMGIYGTSNLTVPSVADHIITKSLAVLTFTAGIIGQGREFYNSREKSKLDKIQNTSEFYELYQERKDLIAGLVTNGTSQHHAPNLWKPVHRDIPRLGEVIVRPEFFSLRAGS